MNLSDREISGCINDIGIPFSTQDLQKPNPQQIQKVFEWFAELLMNTTRDAVAPGMKAAAEDLCGPFSDIFTPDTRDLMGFFVVMRKLLVECGVNDFSFSDLYRPTHPRLVRIFSYIINFVRFRESQTALIDEHFNRSEKTKQRIEMLYAENQNKEDILSDLERNRKSADNAIRAKTDRSNELKERLLELKRDQERVAIKVERMKEEQARLKGLLEERTNQNLTVRQEAEKLRPYTTQSPQALEGTLREMSDNVNRDRHHIDAMDKRARALQTSSESFKTVTADISACQDLLGDLQKDLKAEEATNHLAERNRVALAERSQNVRDIETEERHLQKKLGNMANRTDKLKQAADERRAAEAKKMEELKKVNEGIKKERGERGREMERRRVRIEQTEKKMQDLKENIEAEVSSAREEYVKMDSHVRLYVKEMEACIS